MGRSVEALKRLRKIQRAKKRQSKKLRGKADVLSGVDRRGLGSKSCDLNPSESTDEISHGDCSDLKDISEEALLSKISDAMELPTKGCSDLEDISEEAPLSKIPDAVELPTKESPPLQTNFEKKVKKANYWMQYYYRQAKKEAKRADRAEEACNKRIRDVGHFARFNL